MMGCCLFAFFAKPKAPLYDFVTPKDELPTYEARYPGDTTLSDRVIKSYALAMILVQSPYTQNHVTSLEMIRQWAREQFQLHPDFLHPVSLNIVDHRRDTVFGAAGYNFLAPAKFWLEDRASQLLKMQMANFHSTSAFHSFSQAYFDFFGKDSDTATLLSRYESDRAKQSVNVILWAAAWAAGTAYAITLLIKRRRTDFFGTLQKSVAAAWLLLGTQYVFLTWEDGQSTTLLAAMASITIAAYLYRPFIVASHQEGGQQAFFVKLAPRWIALATWLTLSMFAVQISTWVRSGLPNGNDPVTLLLCGFSGNFVHDPLAGKRLITEIVFTAWIAVSLWGWRQRDKNDAPGAVEEAGLQSLERSVDFQPSI